MGNNQFKRSFYSPFHNSLGLAVYCCGLQRCGGGHSWGPGIRDHYLIHYILSGRGTFDNGVKKYVLGKNDGFLVLPGQLVSYQANQDDPWEYCWVGFNGTDVPRFISETGIPVENPIFHYEKDSQLELLLTDIYQATGPSPWDEARMLASLMNFLAKMMEEFGGRGTIRQTGYEYVKKAIQFIDHNYYREDLDVSQIAFHIGISRSHLYRLFMEYISMPPIEYLTRYRINKAASLLKTGALSIGEVALSTGFSDQLYFSRVFKKQKGISPSRYAGQEKSGHTPALETL